MAQGSPNMAYRDLLCMQQGVHTASTSLVQLSISRSISLLDAPTLRKEYRDGYVRIDWHPAAWL